MAFIHIHMSNFWPMSVCQSPFLALGRVWVPGKSRTNQNYSAEYSGNKNYQNIRPHQNLTININPNILFNRNEFWSVIIFCRIIRPKTWELNVLPPTLQKRVQAWSNLNWIIYWLFQPSYMAWSQNKRKSSALTQFPDPQSSPVQVEDPNLNFGIRLVKQKTILT